MVYRDGDIPGMLLDTGVEFVHAGIVTKALLDTPEAEFLQATGKGGMIGKSVTAIIQSSKHPTISVKDTVKIDGIDYTVIERLKESDGGITRLLCALK